MLEALQGELARAGRSISKKKTKILTTEQEYSGSETPFLVEAGDGMD